MEWKVDTWGSSSRDWYRRISNVLLVQVSYTAIRSTPRARFRALTPDEGMAYFSSRHLRRRMHHLGTGALNAKQYIRAEGPPLLTATSLKAERKWAVGPVVDSAESREATDCLC
jgi:hypothetical protein